MLSQRNSFVAGVKKSITPPHNNNKLNHAQDSNKYLKPHHPNNKECNQHTQILVCIPRIRNRSQFDVKWTFNFVQIARSLPNSANPLHHQLQRNRNKSVTSVFLFFFLSLHYSTSHTTHVLCHNIFPHLPGPQSQTLSYLIESKKMDYIDAN